MKKSISKAVAFLLAFLVVGTLTLPFAYASNAGEINEVTPHSALCADCGMGEVYLREDPSIAFLWLSCPNVPGAYHRYEVFGINYYCRLCGAYNGSKEIYRQVYNECTANCGM